MASVLVTGGTGFLGAHTITRLLADGHQVRTTVRSLARAENVRSMLTSAGAAGIDTVKFTRADLTAEDGWPEAVRGTDYVIHVASPFPARPPENADELIVAARDGVLRVLRAATDAGVWLDGIRGHVVGPLGALLITDARRDSWNRNLHELVLVSVSACGFAAGAGVIAGCGSD